MGSAISHQLTRFFGRGSPCPPLSPSESISLGIVLPPKAAVVDSVKQHGRLNDIHLGRLGRAQPRRGIQVAGLRTRSVPPGTSATGEGCFDFHHRVQPATLMSQGWTCAGRDRLIQGGQGGRQQPPSSANEWVVPHARLGS